MEWTTACPDWEDRIVRGQSLIPCAPLFPQEAAAALEVFKALRVGDLAGKPAMGGLARPWIMDFVATVFGAYDSESGRRLIREFFLMIPKKNTKSTTAAGTMVTALIRNWRPSGEFTILAPTKGVADNSFIPSRDMVRADADLSDLIQVQEHLRTITHRETKATTRVIAADTDTVAGGKSIGVLVDEFWLFGKRAHAKEMLREATGGLTSRPEGFVIYLTTQSDEPPAGVFAEKLQYARDVRDGKIQDKQFLPILYEFPKGMIERGEHRLKKNFYITNPNLGASVDGEYLEREFDKAVGEGEASVRGFLAKHLDVEIGMAMLSSAWAAAPFWESRADTSLTLDEVLRRSEVAVIGIDGGGLDDLLGLGVLGRDRDTREWLLWSKAWAHTSVLNRRKSEASKLQDMHDAGELAIVQTMGEDIAEVVEIVLRVEAAGLLPAENAIGVDPAGIGQIVDALAEADIDLKRITGISQGWKLNGAIKTTERKLADRTLKHAGLALMNWAVGNAKVEPRGNAILITKQASGTAKIDPLMAAFNAVALMSLNPTAPQPKTYQLYFA